MTKTATKDGKPQAKAARKKRLTDDEKAALGEDGALGQDATSGQLFETENVSRRVKQRANKYRDLSVAKSQGNSAFNSGRDSLMEAMEEDGVTSVIIELGGVRKRIVYKECHELKIETVKEEPTVVEHAAST